jgi:hypothetical protein
MTGLGQNQPRQQVAGAAGSPLVAAVPANRTGADLAKSAGDEH